MWPCPVNHYRCALRPVALAGDRVQAGLSLSHDHARRKAGGKQGKDPPLPPPAVLFAQWPHVSLRSCCFVAHPGPGCVEWAGHGHQSRSPVTGGAWGPLNFLKGTPVNLLNQRSILSVGNEGNNTRTPIRPRLLPTPLRPRSLLTCWRTTCCPTAKHPRRPHAKRLAPRRRRSPGRRPQPSRARGSRGSARRHTGEHGRRSVGPCRGPAGGRTRLDRAIHKGEGVPLLDLERGGRWGGEGWSRARRGLRGRVMRGGGWGDESVVQPCAVAALSLICAMVCADWPMIDP